MKMYNFVYDAGNYNGGYTVVADTLNSAKNKIRITLEHKSQDESATEHERMHYESDLSCIDEFFEVCNVTETEVGEVLIYDWLPKFNR